MMNMQVSLVICINVIFWHALGVRKFLITQSQDSLPSRDSNLIPPETRHRRPECGWLLMYWRGNEIHQ